MKVRCTGYKQNYEKFFTVGKIYNVSDKGKITNDKGFIYSNGDYEWLKDKYYNFEEVKDMNCKITIKVEENQTIAKMWENGKCVNEAIAKCAPEDEFVYETGAKLALDRLFATKKNEINISDMVKIIDNGRTYPTYTDWVVKYAPEYAVYFAYNQLANNGTKCRVVAKHTHDTNGKMLYLIRPYNSNACYFNSYACYLISEDGIEKVK